ncbi:expressed unknown protein [Seminavis robusta]|uniref:Uncharacterized protein n=1 Tax=Seminavis robusta TaxID=568900 RepID=A0A9N8D7G3_9STRA|nr:expressed unknown protein [Seminavis robusta]|eukprot:Sro28_g018850.1 n/a (89) ;mRNA; f:140897-141163
MMNTTAPPMSSISVPSSIYPAQADPQQYHQQAQAQAQALPPQRSLSPSPEDHGQRLLAMLNDVLPLVDEDPEMLTLMQDVTRLVCEYQ